MVTTTTFNIMSTVYTNQPVYIVLQTHFHLLSPRDKDEEKPCSETTPENSSSKDDANVVRYQQGTVKGGTASQTNKKKKWCLTLAKVLFGIVLFTSILVCTVFSKLTLVSLTDRLRSVTAVHFNESRTYLYDDDQGETTLKPFLVENDIAVSLYWQLLLIVIIPSIISFLRSLVFGVLGKTSKNFPWPRLTAISTVSEHAVNI